MEIKPEWTMRAPQAWEDRLRQISPIAERTSYLHFRYVERYGTWVLFELVPKSLLSAAKIDQLTVHWSSLPPDEQHGRRQSVNEYKHYMFRTYGVEADPFWILQGVSGGTPAAYTHREKRILAADPDMPQDPPDIGTWDPCDFDERSVAAIMRRDRLYKVGGDLDALLKQNEGASLRAEDAETEHEYRKAFLKWWFEQMAPNSDFMKTYLRTSEASHTLRKATKAEANAVSQWADYFVETGTVLGATHADSRIVIPVA